MNESLETLMCDSDFSQLSNTHKSFRRLLRQLTIFVLVTASLTTFSSTALSQEGTFIPVANLNTAATGSTATLLDNGLVLIAGGEGTTYNTLASAELYDPVTSTFTPTGGMTAARRGHTATLLKNGQVLIAGGADTTLMVSAELYDPATATFTPTGSMTAARQGHTATLLNNGTVLITGGGPCSFYGCLLASAEIYDPVTGTFTATGSMTTGRVGNTATLLSDGTVLIVGGEERYDSYLASAELYVPGTGTFVPTGSLTTARVFHTATLLNDGKVLVAGGLGGGGTATLASAELYDPATGTFTPTGSMTTARWRDTSTPLNGIVLIVGGLAEPGTYLTSAEFYDPATGVFSPTGNMTTAREGHTATLLNNGTVLIAGGWNNTLAIASAELYELVVVSPTQLSFSDQLVGTSAAATPVALRNAGPTVLVVTNIVISGVNASDFSETDNCVGSLAAGATCTTLVTFSPTVTGTRSGILAISNNLSGSPVPVALTGTAIAATHTANLSSSSLTFEGVIVGAASAARAVTLSNGGNTNLTISGLVIGGANASDFTESDNCSGTVVAGASCTINVSFSPTATGTRTGILTITDNATSPASPQVVTLTGIGQDFSITSLTQSATITPGQTATYLVSVVPHGGFNQSVSFSCAGAPLLSTCSVSPGSVTLSGSSPSPITVTVETMTPVLGSLNDRGIAAPYAGSYRQLAVLTSFFAALIGILARKNPLLAHYPVTKCLLLITLCIAIGMAGCGGGDSVRATPQPGTPPGTYSLTVSATFTSSSAASTTVVRNTKLTLVVQ